MGQVACGRARSQSFAICQHNRVPLRTVAAGCSVPDDSKTWVSCGRVHILVQEAGGFLLMVAGSVHAGPKWELGGDSSMQVSFLGQVHYLREPVAKQDVLDAMKGAPAGSTEPE